MRLVLGTISVFIVPVGALAHVGHVGELAGHSHWVGVAAVVGAVAVAAIAAKLRKRGERTDDEAESQTEGGDQTAEEAA
ncbi:MAG: hypothetical protein P1U37_12310 [Minwuia sp.]|nr:hypothetical protein [Minwuia sp.]